MSLKNSMQLVRHFSRSAAVCKNEVHPGYAKIKALQEHFQKPNGLPVHLKGGPMDKVLFGITVVLCVAGLVGFGDLVYKLGFQKKEA